MPRLEINPAALERVVLLTAALRTLSRLSDDEAEHRRQVFRARYRVPIGADAATWRPPHSDSGVNYDLNLGEFQESMRAIDNDLAQQVHIAASNVAHFLASGISAPPHFPKRIAVILRKARQYGLEVSFLTEYVRLFCDVGEDADSWPVTRLAKARMLAAKAHGTPLASPPIARAVLVISQGDESLAYEFISEMRQLPPPSAEEIAQRRADYEAAHPWWEGIASVELLSGGADEPDSNAEAASLDDFAGQLRLAAEYMERFLKNGLTPSYSPPHRVAVLLRRARLFACEAAFCIEWARLCQHDVHAHADRWVTRSEKALALAAA